VVCFAAIAVVALAPELRIVTSRPAEDNQVLLIRNRQRAEQHRIEAAKDRCVGTDTQGQGDDYDRSKPRILEKLADAVDDIAANILQLHEPPSLPAPLRREAGVAEIE
jgi:hypothetical protein